MLTSTQNKEFVKNNSFYFHFYLDFFIDFPYQNAVLLQGSWEIFLFRDFLINPSNQDAWLNKQQENPIYNAKTLDFKVQTDDILLLIKSGVQI